MAINLTKNRDSLLKTWQEVFEDSSDIDWAVFGYDGKTNILKVVETGDGGLQEMQDDLNEGKMLYGVVKVMDPNTNLPKIVFINWQGEGVPSSRKGVCANHARDVEKFFKGAHVTIIARSSDDVEESVVLEKVKKASGANYSFHKEKAKPAEPITPVGSVYQRVKVQQDINVQKRDDFWSKAEQEEKKRIEQQRRQAIAEKNEAERKRKEREAKEAEQRDVAYRERSRSIDEQRRKQREVEEKKKQEERKRWEDQQLKDEREMQEEKKRANSLRQARLKEAEQLIHQGQQEKPKFKELTTPAAPPIRQKPPPRRPPPQVQQPHPEPEPEPEPELEPEVEWEPTPKPEPQLAPAQPIPEPQEEPGDLYENVEGAPYDEPEPNQYNAPDQEIYEQVDETNNGPNQYTMQEQDAFEEGDSTYEQVESKEATEPEPAADEQFYSNVADPQDASAASSGPGEGRTQSARALYDYQAENEEEISFDPGDIITEIDQFDEGWWKGRGPSGSYGMFPSNFVELLGESSETTAEHPLTEEDRGIQARALYDYQATDETEITFDPGDIITNIEQIDEGWWRGQGPDGNFGLFPANYVELIA